MQVSEVFDAAAEAFARWTPLLWEPVGEAAVRAAGLRPGDRVLDACCGNGAAAIPAARGVSPAGHVDAVDLSGALLRDGRERAAARGVGGIRFRRADATAWTADGKPGYDAVLCLFGVFFFPDLDAGGRHLVRLLRPGGRFLATTWEGGAVEPVVRPFAEAAAAERAAAGLPAPDLSRQRKASARLESADGLARWLREIGATGPEVRSVTPEIPLDAARAWDFVIGSGTRGLLFGLGEAAVSRIRRRFWISLQEQGTTVFRPTVLIGHGSRTRTA
ncbi:class I SAM-dependent methyltransferase [Amycolatopsis orientalis]|uniref:class I SAM-dependent methyltransferase n=1 Tax=Amycolatopsis orientalis TaxID=31958 RepID=UPI0003A69F3C|nr:methyltransferase domain-containing protein [Amycolatopsis orientalis]